MDPISWSFSTERDTSDSLDLVDITDEGLRAWLGDVVSTDKLFLTGESFRGLELVVSQVCPLVQAAFELSAHKRVAKCKILQVRATHAHAQLPPPRMHSRFTFVAS